LGCIANSGTNYRSAGAGFSINRIIPPNSRNNMTLPRCEGKVGMQDFETKRGEDFVEKHAE